MVIIKTSVVYTDELVEKKNELITHDNNNNCKMQITHLRVYSKVVAYEVFV